MTPVSTRFAALESSRRKFSRLHRLSRSQRGRTGTA